MKSKEKEHQQDASLKGQDINLDMEIDFIESVMGLKKILHYKKQIICDACKGQKGKPGARALHCEGCGGRGHIVTKVKGVIEKSDCSECNGFGDYKPVCEGCNGKGILEV